MRRLVVEFSLKGLAEAERELFRFLTKVKSVEMVQILKAVPGERAMIARVEMMDRAEVLEDLFPSRPDAEIETELLQRENERTSVYFIRVKVKIPPKASEASPF
jgi:hypothetical protein